MRSGRAELVVEKLRFDIMEGVPRAYNQQFVFEGTSSAQAPGGRGVDGGVDDEDGGDPSVASASLRRSLLGGAAMAVDGSDTEDDDGGSGGGGATAARRLVYLGNCEHTLLVVPNVDAIASLVDAQRARKASRGYKEVLALMEEDRRLKLRRRKAAQVAVGGRGGEDVGEDAGATEDEDAADVTDDEADGQHEDL